MAEHLPTWLRALAAFALFTFGPGAGLTFRLLAPLPRLVRVVLAVAAGVALSPMLAHVLGLLHLIAIYPYVCAALGAVAIASWWRAPEPPPMARASVVAMASLVIVAASIGTAAFAHRLTESAGSTVVYGDYDSYDLTYYAAIAAESSHTIPPASPFFSGRMLDHPYYPHALLAMVHRFGGVPTLELYFRFAWPAFLCVAMLACFVFVEGVSTTWSAWTAAVLFGAGSNLAYAAGWMFSRSTWDEVIWAHNLQGAGAEVLLYGNWTPAFCAMFAALYGLHAAARTGRRGWAVMAGVLFGSTVLSKPWIFASVMPALIIVIVARRREGRLVRQLGLVAASALFIAAPLLIRSVLDYADAQVTWAPAFFPIPLKMAARIGLEQRFLAIAGALHVSGAAQAGLAGLLAAPLFLAGTIGARIVALPRVWRALRMPGVQDPVWAVLAWTMVVALLASCFIVSVPYHESQQIHQFALFLLAPFAGAALGAVGPRWRAAATVAVVALAVPSTVQYLNRSWNDFQFPLATMTRGDAIAATFLASTDPDATVILHDHPDEPALLGIAAERRSVLAWAGYVRGNQPREDDVNAFFAAPGTDKARQVLKAYRPTHVIEHMDRDRIDPAVREQMQLVVRSGDVALYRVPESLR